MRRPTLGALFMTVGLPLIMLLLGWQLRASYDQVQLQGLAGINDSFTNGTASGQVLGDPEKEANLTLFWTVWRLLQQHYIMPQNLQPRSMVLSAIQGLVQGVGDPYTVFMPPQENADFQNTLQGKLQGIGAELTVKDGAITVVSPLRGSPAERAGILPGDVIMSVDDKKIEGLSLNDVVTLIRGQKGTKVTLQITRQGKTEPLTITIVREDVTVPTVESRIITASGSSIGYIALNQFGENSMQEVRDALAGFKKQPLKGIILDLRFNGGGYLDGAVDLVSMFLTDGEIVAVQSRGDQIERHYASGNPLFPTTPLVVLINQASASASEIAAGALQDHKRATIVGMKSFGKGTVQEVIDLPGGSSLRVTIARWLTPNGKNLGKEGVQPDVVIERGQNDVIGKQDAQLDRAVQVLLGKAALQ